ncbi:hypothetical protein [Sorangium sp. So ce426]|uniref:hypothetical protein n=1 Tax=Sorangium sp. So ce426 TaxID=3133312 RepID=UPI003F5C8950
MSKRGVTVFLDDELENRVNQRRVAGKRIRSFSAVTREALSRGLDVLEQEQRNELAVAAISSAPRFSANNNAGGAPEGA